MLSPADVVTPLESWSSSEDDEVNLFVSLESYPYPSTVHVLSSEALTEVEDVADPSDAKPTVQSIFCAPY